MGWIVELLGGGALTTIFGGITGLFGAYFTNKKEMKMAELEYADKANSRQHDVNMADKHLEGMKLEHTKDMHIADTEAEAKMTESADKLMVSSYTMAANEVGDTSKEGWFGRLTEYSRRWVRIVASFGSMYILIMAMQTVLGWVEEDVVTLNQEQLGELVQYVVWTTMYISSTILLWWFGVRGKRPKELVHHAGDQGRS